jgi:succinate dehydrogenase / fumarate reductase, cytochrome b subunit
MSVALARENYFLHKLHSLTGIIPVGFYMIQHLTLNSFSIAGRDQFNAVIGFFGGMPIHLLLLLEVVAIWFPLAFHGIYGLFITSRAQQNYVGTKYRWSQNRMYTFQRVSGIFIFFFLIYHVTTTTGRTYLTGSREGIMFDAWHVALTSNFYILLVFYMLGVLASSYHLAYGVWNFCIRWGITISDAAQIKLQKFAAFLFVAVTLLGWLALAGFVVDRPPAQPIVVEAPTREIPQSTQP